MEVSVVAVFNLLTANGWSAHNRGALAKKLEHVTLMALVILRDLFYKDLRLVENDPVEIIFLHLFWARLLDNTTNT